ncbi:MAG: DUF4037 domain-containing protein, partial [Chloroflexi bacterium]|nr:DUF4037 domain-containing protein [Chloroflexota bacterium]
MHEKTFIPSLDLNEAFFNEVVRPLLSTHFPNLRYSAARLGQGSDVLGYDTPMSMDHAWGIQFQIFLTDVDCEQVGTAVHEMLRQQLPYEYKGFSTHFVPAGEEGVLLAVKKEEGLVDPNITVTTIAAFFDKHMKLNPFVTWQSADWLTTSQQLLLGVTKGRVFVDDLGDLEPIRQKLAYFPHDVWLYILACQWARIGQEEHFMGRTGLLGDDVGSRLLASRLV